MNLIEKLKIVLGRVEKIVGKGENAGYQHFLLFQQYFLKASFSRSLKVTIVWQRVNCQYVANSYNYQVKLCLQEKFFSCLFFSMKKLLSSWIPTFFIYIYFLFYVLRNDLFQNTRLRKMADNK